MRTHNRSSRQAVKVATAGETVLLTQGNSTRWVRVVHAAPAREHDGLTTQIISVQVVDQFGRSKPKLVQLGNGAKIEWAA